MVMCQRSGVSDVGTRGRQTLDRFRFGFSTAKWRRLMFLAGAILGFVMIPATVTSSLADESHRPLHDSLVADTSRDAFETLSEEIDAVFDQYQAWGLDRTTFNYTFEPDQFSFQQLNGLDWNRYTPDEVREDRLLRSQGRFYSERRKPESQRTLFAYDGKVSRIRSPYGLHNGPVDRIKGMIEDSVSSPLPHTMLVDFFYFPTFDWLFGITSQYESFLGGSVTDEIRVSEVDHQGHRCWKVEFTLTKLEFGAGLTFCKVLLSRDRSLLPIHQTFHTPIDKDLFEFKQVVVDEIVWDEPMSIWIPKTVTASVRNRREMQVSRVHFKPCREYENDATYTDIGIVSPEHGKPAPPIVAAYAPEPILSSQGAVTFTMLASQRDPNRRVINNALIGIGLLVAVIFVTLRRTRFGSALRRLAASHRIVLDLVGVAAAVGVAHVCGLPPGWTTYGLTMMLVGLFGLGWILFSLLLIGEKTISIRTTLSVAGCMAIFFAGYNQGIRRMEIRQRMIDEVRGNGGYVTVGSWHRDEDGLYLPALGDRLLGEAWSGRASEAAVEQSMFTADNVRRWCLNEVQWLGVASEQRQPFEVRSEALAKIEDSDTIWTFHAEEGFIGGSAFEQLARFNHLTHLSFDCQGRDLASEITHLKSLERVSLTNVVVNESLVETLAGVENLDFVTLVTPRFDGCGRKAGTLQFEAVTISYAQLTPDDFATIGRIPTKIILENCVVSVPRSKTISMAETTELVFRNCRLGDQTLPTFSQTPKLSTIKLSQSGVSVRGVEAYSQRRPDVHVALE